MMGLPRLPIATVIATALALPATAATTAETPKLFTLTSPTIKDDAMLPVKYAGNN